MSCCNVKGNSAFGPSKRIVKLTKDGWIAQEGPFTRAKLSTCDVQLGWSTIQTVSINIAPLEQGVELNFAGFGDNFESIILQVSYDQRAQLITDRWLQWQFKGAMESSTLTSILVLSGSTYHKFANLVLSNPTNYPITIQAMVMKTDDIKNLFPAQMPQDLETTTITGLSFDDITSSIADYNIYVNAPGETTPVLYTTTNNIGNISISGNTIDIDDISAGQIILQFIDQWNAKQAYSALMWMLDDPLNRSLPQPADMIGPVITWVPNHSLPVAGQPLQRTTRFTLQTGQTKLKTELVNYLITSIVDARDGIMIVDPQTLRIFRGSVEQGAITGTGLWTLCLSIFDNAGNGGTYSISANVIPYVLDVLPPVITLTPNVVNGGAIITLGQTISSLSSITQQQLLDFLVASVVDDLDLSVVKNLSMMTVSTPQGVVTGDILIPNNYTVNITAEDVSGNISSDTISVLVNQVPVVMSWKPVVNVPAQTALVAYSAPLQASDLITLLTSQVNIGLINRAVLPSEVTIRTLGFIPMTAITAMGTYLIDFSIIQGYSVQFYRITLTLN